MTVVVLLGSPGRRQGNPGAGPRRHLGVPVLASGDLLRTAVADGHAARPRGRSLHEPRPARPRRDDRPGLPRPARAARRARSARSSTGSPGRGSRPRRSTSPSARPAAGSIGRSSSTSRPRTSSGGWRTAGSAPPTATSTTSPRTRRSSTGVCDLDGSPLIQRPDDHEATVRARMSEQIPPLLEVVEHYRDAGRAPDRRRPRADQRGQRARPGGRSTRRCRRSTPRAGAGRLMVTRKSRREIEKMRTAGRIVAEVLALVESELKPGVSTGHLDRLAERHIRSAGAVPSFKGYGHRSNPFPASLCISIDDEVVHGIPGERVDPRRPDRVGRRRRDLRRLARRRRPDVRRRRRRRRRSASSSTRPASR